MKKVLLLNQGHTDNIGDIAIQKTISVFFQNKNYIVDNYPFWSEELVFSKNVFIRKIFVKLFWFNPNVMDLFNMISIRKNCRKKKYDAIIIGGGELLSKNRGFISSIDMWSKYAQNKGIPIFLIGVSGDCDIPQKYIEKNKISLTRYQKIFVRDSYTKQMLNEKYNIQSKIYPDIVFSYKKIISEQKLPKKENAMICIPINYNCIKNSYLKDVNSKIEYFNYLYKLVLDTDNIEKLYITTSVDEDIEISKQFYNFLKTKKLDVNIEYIQSNSLDSLIDLLSKTKCIISGRMHPMILGLLYNNKIVPISFKEKLACFAKEYSRVNDINKIEKKSLESLNNLHEFIKNN